MPKIIEIRTPKVTLIDGSVIELEIGQIWYPGQQTQAYPKIITKLVANGSVYAAMYPREENALPSCFKL